MALVADKNELNQQNANTRKMCARAHKKEKALQWKKNKEPAAERNKSMKFLWNITLNMSHFHILTCMLRIQKSFNRFFMFNASESERSFVSHHYTHFMAFISGLLSSFFFVQFIFSSFLCLDIQELFHTGKRTAHFLIYKMHDVKTSSSWCCFHGKVKIRSYTIISMWYVL